MKHFRSLWYPSLMDRSSYGSWSDNGAKDLFTNLREKVLDILANHRPPPLEPQTEATNKKILERTKAQHPLEDG